MRYAVVSDLHSNLQAWTAVLLDIRSLRADRIICLGDVVGYGPNPAEVMQSVHAEVDNFVLGNHDAVVCGKMDANLFNDEARRSIFWTRKKLGATAVRFLSTLPLTLTGPGFRCAHGDFAKPGAFHYVIDAVDAVPSWQAVPDPLLFVGHTHEPAIFVMGRSGKPHKIGAQDFGLEPEKIYLVNVGSVGQPRDGDIRASYVLYDDTDRSVTWRRVPFDLDAYRLAVDRAGIGLETSAFLRHDPRKGKPALREMLNFSPPTSAKQAVRRAVHVQEITVLQKRVARWRGIAALTALGAALLLGTGAWAWWHSTHQAVRIADPAMMPVQAAAFSVQGLSSRDTDPVPANRNLLNIPGVPVDPGHVIPGWEVRLGQRQKQSASVTMADGSPVFVLDSDAPRTELTLASYPILVRSGQRFRVYGEFETSADLAGDVAIYIATRDKDGHVNRDWFRKAPDVQAEEAGWQMARKVFPDIRKDFPPDTVSIQLEVRGEFTGRVRIRNLGLVRFE